VLLPVDVPARPVQRAVKPSVLLRREPAARASRVSLGYPNPRLLGFEPRGLAARQFAAAEALADAMLLMPLARVDRARVLTLGLRGHGRQRRAGERGRRQSLQSRNHFLLLSFMTFRRPKAVTRLDARGETKVREMRGGIGGRGRV